MIRVVTSSKTGKKRNWRTSEPGVGPTRWIGRLRLHAGKYILGLTAPTGTGVQAHSATQPGGYMPGPTEPFKKNTSLRKRRGTQRGSPYEKIVTEYKRARDKAYYGSLGGASPVRKIDPKTGEVVAVIDPVTGLPMSPGIKH